MSLIKCPECFNQVSTTAQSCPNCGAIITEKSINLAKTKNNSPFTIVIIIVAIAVFLIIFSLEADASNSRKLIEKWDNENKQSMKDMRYIVESTGHKWKE